MKLKNTYFLTFADRKLSASLQLIKGEAALFGFEKIFAWDERNLDRSFWYAHKDFIKNNRRGFGYWIWKPQAVLQVLKQIPEGSCLVYADAGCRLNIEGKKRLLEYKEMAEDHKGLKMVAHRLYGNAGDILMWNKMDLLGLFENHKNAFICAAAAFVCINTPATRNFVKAWLEICLRDNYHFVDDSPSVLPNHKKFRGHRHDQSIYSLLVYKHNAKIIDDETYPPPPQNSDWNTMAKYPIHVVRRRKFKKSFKDYMVLFLKYTGLFALIFGIYKRIKKR